MIGKAMCAGRSTGMCEPLTDSEVGIVLLACLVIGGLAILFAKLSEKKDR